MQLQPRSRPINSDSDDTSRSSIFGKAKPVDTTAREKEIEERLRRQQEQQDKPRPSSRGESRSDSRGDFRDSRRDSRDSRRDSRDSRGDSCDSRGDSRDSRGDSRDSRGDSRDSRGDSRDSRGDSRSDARRDSSRGTTSRATDKEQAVKKVVKEAKPSPSTGNAWLKGKPRILEKQDDAPVSSMNHCTNSDKLCCRFLANLASLQPYWQKMTIHHKTNSYRNFKFISCQYVYLWFIPFIYPVL